MQKLLLTTYRKSYEKSISTKMNDLDLCLMVVQGHVNHCGVNSSQTTWGSDFKFGTRFFLTIVIWLSGSTYYSLLWGSTVGYPSDSFASCYTFLYRTLIWNPHWGCTPGTVWFNEFRWYVSYFDQIQKCITKTEIVTGKDRQTDRQTKIPVQWLCIFEQTLAQVRFVEKCIDLHANAR